MKFTKLTTETSVSFCLFFISNKISFQLFSDYIIIIFTRLIVFNLKNKLCEEKDHLTRGNTVVHILLGDYLLVVVNMSDVSNN